MTIQVELSPEAEARLTAEARLRGVALEKYASTLLQESLVPHGTGTGILTPEQVETMLSALSEGSENLPILSPEANERAS